jgi:AAA domain
MKHDINDTLRTEGVDAARARHDQARRYNGQSDADETANKPRFQLVPFDQLRPGKEPVYLVKVIIPRSGIAVIWGPPKCGKSFWLFDMLLHVALGWPYRGRRVLQGPVVYCAFEGADGYRGRAEAFRMRFLAEHTGPVPLYLVAAKMVFLTDHAALIDSIRTQLNGQVPVAVALDTLNRSIGGKEDDENMAGYIAAADAVRETFGCVVPIVHHCGVDGTRPRGHTSLTGAADAQIAVKRDTAGNVIVTVEWMKDGPEGDQIVSRLERVVVGTDEDGEQITSCVVVPVDGASAATATRWPKALVFYHRAVCEALATFGKNSLPFDIDGPAVRTVNREHVRSEFKLIYPADGDSEAKRGDALKQAFKRAEKDALARNLVGCREKDGSMMFWSMKP